MQIRRTPLVLDLTPFMLALVVAFGFMLNGCAYLKAHALDDVLSLVTPERALECAEQPTPKDRARCVGVDFMDDALALALQRAGELAAQALEARAPSGAERPMSERDEAKLAADLEEALFDLAAEIHRVRDIED